MVTRIIEFSAKNKFLVLAMTVALLFGSWWSFKNIALDAIPDLSDTQVIVYSKWDRSPDIIEDQVTYPIVTSLLGSPGVKAIRGISDFGYSYVYVIFQDGTDLYWARSRVLEYLSKITSKLPDGVKTEIGPDATSIGWVYQYALVDDSHTLDLSQLRSLQDWSLKYHLQSVPGVAEVASLGGFVKQYQVTLDPNKLTAYNIKVPEVVNALRSGNNETGGRIIELSGREYMVRGRGYAKNVSDLEKIVLRSDEKTGAPILVGNVARVVLGPDMRRGVSDLNGMGDTAGGIVIMRQGENVVNVIAKVKEKLKEIEPSLPKGVRIVPTYDRSSLVYKALDTLTHELILEVIIVSGVILLFLWHIPSAIVPILTIPISVFLAFIPLYFMGVTSNIMSLAGIAISIGVLVDGAIVEVENAYKKLEEWNSTGRKGDFHEIRLNALKQVGPSVFFSLLVIAVSFLPIFMLVDQEGRLFKPLAISKTLAMALAAFLAVTVDPALRMLFARMDPFTFHPRWLSRVASTVLVGKYYPEEKHPISRVLFKLYEPVVHFVLRHAKLTIGGAVLIVLATIPAYFKLGSEFMPRLEEGSFLYMPTSFPGLSIAEAGKLLQTQGKILKEFPEVEAVHGKAGRADTATDPAPLSMFETTISLKPVEEWPHSDRFYSNFPEFIKPLFRWALPEHGSFEELQSRMNERLQFPGMPNIWTMPIRNRIDMLSTGIRTPVGIKILGADVKIIQDIGEKIEAALRPVPDTRNVYAERAADGYYLDIILNRDALARYGISVEEANLIINSAIGGENVSFTVEGRERYPINVRYEREFRDNPKALERVLVPTSSGAQVPISQLAEIKMVQGPSMIRNENGLLAGYVFIDVTRSDIGGYIEEAKRAVQEKVLPHIPTGYSLNWSGQYENMLRVEERLKIVVPVTLFLIFLLLYLNTGSTVKTLIVLLAVPFSLVGAVWFLYILDYNVSIAVWVGMIALMGLDAETGVFMLMYLDFACDEQKKQGRLGTQAELREAIIHGAVKRIRPKLMTVMAAFMGLLPIMFAMGIGSDVMKRIAAPMVGGLATSFILELLVYPAIYFLWKKRTLLNAEESPAL